MIFIRLGLLLVMLIGTNVMYAGENVDSVDQRNHQIGLKTGLNSGNSLAYRYWPGYVGMEVSIAPRFNNAFTEVSLGLAGLLKLREGTLFDYYGTIGNDIFYTESNSEFLSPYSRNNQGFTWDVKAGIGVEVELVDQVVLNGVFGAVNERMIRGEANIKPNAELSLFYAF